MRLRADGVVDEETQGRESGVGAMVALSRQCNARTGAAWRVQAANISCGRECMCACVNIDVLVGCVVPLMALGWAGCWGLQQNGVKDVVQFPEKRQMWRFTVAGAVVSRLRKAAARKDTMRETILRTWEVNDLACVQHSAALKYPHFW
jgi:hypothetical protein